MSMMFTLEMDSVRSRKVSFVDVPDTMVYERTLKSAETKHDEERRFDAIERATKTLIVQCRTPRDNFVKWEQIVLKNRHPSKPGQFDSFIGGMWKWCAGKAPRPEEVQHHPNVHP